jgi:hypothetical protein
MISGHRKHDSSVALVDEDDPVFRTQYLDIPFDAQCQHNANDLYVWVDSLDESHFVSQVANILLFTEALDLKHTELSILSQDVDLKASAAGRAYDPLLIDKLLA